MALPAHDHPVWKVLGNLTIALIALVVTATEFDASEMKTLMLLLGGNVGLEIWSRR